MKTKLLLLIPLVLLIIPEAEARRRRRARGPGRISGTLQVTVKSPPEATRAYWSFGVANLQTKRPPVPFGELVVYLDVWDEAALPAQRQTELTLEGAEASPPLLVIPRSTSAVTVVFRNQDGLTYRFTSKDHSELRSLIVPPRGREHVKMEGIPHKPPGEFVQYRIRTSTQPYTRAEILMLRSSAYAHPDAQGRFAIKGLPTGPRTLRVYYRGQILLEKKVEVGRRPLDLGALKITLTEPRTRTK